MGGKCNGFILVGSFLPLSITVCIYGFICKVWKLRAPL